MSRRFAGRVALVTGAAGDGCGQAIARRLAAEGAAVVVTDAHERRTAEVAESLRKEHGERVLGLALDVADRARAEEVVAAAAGRLGVIDILVNNVALNELGDVVDCGPEEWDRVIDVNLRAAYSLIHRLLPGMMRKGLGSIVNISSVAAWIGSGREAPYAASKAALHSLTRSVAYEAGPRGVRCNAVATGVVWSRFVRKYEERLRPLIDQTPLRRFGDPEEIAAVVAFLVSDESSFVTGEVLNASGGFYMRP